VDEAGHQALEQLALPEDDYGLVAGAGGDVVAALDGAAGADEVDEELRTTGKEEAGGRERDTQRDGSDCDVYRSAPMAIARSGTIRAAPASARR
jgi:hypothetical protein